MNGIKEDIFTLEFIFLIKHIGFTFTNIIIMKNIFKTAYIGKPYKTRDERKFIFLGFIRPTFGRGKAIEGMIEGDDLFTYYNTDGKPLYCEYNGFAKNAFNVDYKHVLTDCEYLDIVSEWDENRFFKCPYCGNVVKIGSSGKYIDCPCCKKRYKNKEITNNIFNITEEYGNLKDQLDALYMRYLSQVSLWKSCYDELKQKILEQVDDKELDEQIAEKENPNYNISCNSLEYTRWNAGFVAGYKYLKSELEKFVNNKREL